MRFLSHQICSSILFPAAERARTRMHTPTGSGGTLVQVLRRVGEGRVGKGLGGCESSPGGQKKKKKLEKVEKVKRIRTPNSFLDFLEVMLRTSAQRGQRRGRGRVSFFRFFPRLSASIVAPSLFRQGALLMTPPQTRRHGNHGSPDAVSRAIPPHLCVASDIKVKSASLRALSGKVMND